MTERQIIFSGSKWEPIVGYSRAVRVDRHVYVAGTVASNEHGQVVGAGDIGAQARYALQKIERALHQAGAELRHVVRTRMYVTDAQLWEAVAEVHHEFFAEITPVATMLEVSALIGAEYLIEIEVEAYIHDA